MDKKEYLHSSTPQIKQGNYMLCWDCICSTCSCQDSRKYAETKKSHWNVAVKYERPLDSAAAWICPKFTACQPSLGLQEENIRHIYASPFLRTVQTAHQVASVLSVPVRVEYGLSEGLFESACPGPWSVYLRSTAGRCFDDQSSCFSCLYCQTITKTQHIFGVLLSLDTQSGRSEGWSTCRIVSKRTTSNEVPRRAEGGDAVDFPGEVLLLGPAAIPREVRWRTNKGQEDHWTLLAAASWGECTFCRACPFYRVPGELPAYAFRRIVSSMSFWCIDAREAQILAADRYSPSLALQVVIAITTISPCSSLIICSRDFLQYLHKKSSTGPMCTIYLRGFLLLLQAKALVPEDDFRPGTNISYCALADCLRHRDSNTWSLGKLWDDSFITC